MDIKKLFNYQRINERTIFTLFGIKMKFRDKNFNMWSYAHNYYCANNKIDDKSQYYNNNYLRNLTIAQQLHKETFNKYKNCNYGKDVVLVATGPTLNEFEPIKDAVYVGVNKAKNYDKINLDYYFAIDYAATVSYLDNTFKDGEKTVRFYGYFNIDAFPQMMIPESIALRHNAKRFIAFPSWNSNENIRFGYEPNIDMYPLHCNASVVMCALQFILFTNPKRIFLVGCDCSTLGHFDKDSINYFNDNSIDILKNEWLIFKKIVNYYYPETEIISVNPVGLKGLFKDIFTTKENK